MITRVFEGPKVDPLPQWKPPKEPEFQFRGQLFVDTGDQIMDERAWSELMAKANEMFFDDPGWP